MLLIQEKLKIDFPSPTDFTNVAGRGLKCTVEGSSVLVGNRQFLEEDNTEKEMKGGRGTELIPPMLLARGKVLGREGKTCVLVAIDGRAVALVALSDVLKPEAHYVIDFLRYVWGKRGREGEVKKESRESYYSCLFCRRQGNDIYMVTGDNKRVAAHVGRSLNLPEVLIILYNHSVPSSHLSRPLSLLLTLSSGPYLQSSGASREGCTREAAAEPGSHRVLRG